jgi:hypothetical protein
MGILNYYLSGPNVQGWNFHPRRFTLASRRGDAGPDGQAVLAKLRNLLDIKTQRAQVEGRMSLRTELGSGAAFYYKDAAPTALPKAACGFEPLNL